VKVAIMQPYFMPYAGYFRLFAAVDIFVALDCVQFPRRGWVHRNRFTDQKGELQWLTVPLKKSDRDATRICDLQFQENANALLRDETRRFRSLKAIQQYTAFADILFDIGVSPNEYFISSLLKLARLLGIERPVIRSSTLNVDPRLRAQERIIEIAKRVGGTDYINSPGGKGIYDEVAFEKAGLTLSFLSDYRGSHSSILERIIEDGVELVGKEIHQNLILCA
jgi:hypothetical protein